MKLKLFIISLLFLSCNGYCAYIDHHYEEKTEEKFVSEHTLNSNAVVVACFVKYKDFFSMDNPSLKDTLNACKDKKRIIEKLNKVKYKFGKVRGYLPYSKEAVIELIEVKNQQMKTMTSDSGE